MKTDPPMTVSLDYLVELDDDALGSPEPEVLILPPASDNGEESGADSFPKQDSQA